MISLAGMLRGYMIADTAITGKLSVYKGVPAVFTRRPLDAGVEYPAAIISPQIGYTSERMLNADLGIVNYDVSVYGKNDTPASYRNIEDCAFAVFNRFNYADPTALSAPAGYSIVQITASGPTPAPTDDDELTGRLVRLSIRMSKD